MAGLPRVTRAGVRNAEIEQRSKDIKTADEEQRGLGARVDQRQLQIEHGLHDPGQNQPAAERGARMIEPTVVPSIQPFAITSFSGGNSSVRMPYLAGEYAAASNPTIPHARSGCMPASDVKQPMNLIVFVISITRLLGIASARAPTKAASATWKKTKNSLSSGVIQAGAA